MSNQQWDASVNLVIVSCVLPAVLILLCGHWIAAEQANEARAKETAAKSQNPCKA